MIALSLEILFFPQTAKTVIRTVPSSIISMAKAGTAGIQTTPGGTKTIVIAAPKGGAAGATPTRILSGMPKTVGQGNTQFIVVSPQGSSVVTPGNSTLASAVGKWNFIVLYQFGHFCSCKTIDK